MTERIIEVCQATDSAELRERIMNPSVAKSESEWWAARHIAELEAENEEWKRKYTDLDLFCKSWAAKCIKAEATIEQWKDNYGVVYERYCAAAEALERIRGLPRYSVDCDCETGPHTTFVTGNDVVLVAELEAALNTGVIK